MTEMEQQEKELQIAMERFASSLKRVEIRSQKRLSEKLEREQVLISTLRMLAAEKGFSRAFSQKEQEDLMDRLYGLEMGRCAPQLQNICELIEGKLQKQQQTDAMHLAKLQKDFRPEEYQQYEAMFRSDLFLNYFENKNRGYE